MPVDRLNNCNKSVFVMRPALTICLLTITSILLVLLSNSVLYAKEGSVTFAVEGGYYRPSLKTLSTIFSEKRFAIRDDPNFLLPGNVVPDTSEQFARNLETGELTGDITYGIVVEWHAFKRHSLLLSLSIWEDALIKSDMYPLPLIDFLNPFLAPRSVKYNLEINQLWLGWKYEWLHLDKEKKKKARLFTNIELFGVSMVYLTMDSLLKVNAPDFGQHFGSISSTEAFGIGYTSRFTLGGEFFLAKWVSLSVRGGYIIGQVAKLKVKRYFPPSFPPTIEFLIPPDSRGGNVEPPELPVKGDTLLWGADASTNIRRDLASARNLTIELDGLDLSMAIRFHF